MRPHIMPVANLELNYIHTLLTFPWYTIQTVEHRTWHFGISVTSTYSINWTISSCFLWNIDKLLKSLTSTKCTLLYKRALHKCSPFRMTKTHWILHFPPKLPAISWFWQTWYKIPLMKAETLSLGPVAASLPHTEKRSQLSTSDHCLKGHLKAYIWENFFL